MKPRPSWEVLVAEALEEGVADREGGREEEEE
jgi:hypothetical protein